ncbi:hypothetical protein SAMN05660866_00826 [Maribacter arcticus]|uniref:Uncharacterized protein n=2 Tax=Maribacter arcticus TaxID=561365 RepID=A0A1T5ACP6_9FLAO|nr:hypothetical protein SAMN05660866_00826 [Maribacter arcticus]|tara:strand:+ start:322 stop:600 length:279 start_codon:yes stop_codon:yes gene_type:complete
MTMGFSGHATQVLKSNRVLLKKSRSFRELRKDYLDYSQETKLHFKELTDVERKMVRDKIRAQAKKDSIQKTGIYILSLAIVLGVFYAIYNFR